MQHWPKDCVPHLYVHVPFCAHKCDYCAFFSQVPAAEQVQRYVGALVRELELVAGETGPETVFFGGGTPSILTVKQWAEVLEAMVRLGLLGAREWTVECNPATVSLEKAKLLRDYGVNRISMGVQSLDGGLLERLGRIHSRGMVFKSFEILRQAGFENINIDLMFGIPGQRRKVWRETLREALALGSEHLSSYEVIYEEDTPLFAQLQAGQFSVDEDLVCEMYEALVDVAGEHGYRQYEISNFARERWGGGGEVEVPGYACGHNVAYWRGESYEGLGPSASGFVGGVRTKNWSNTTLYCARLEKGRRAIEFAERLSPLGRAGEIAAFGLRMNAGWPFDLFRERTGFDLHEEWGSEMADLIEGGFAEADSDRFNLTRRGLRWADWAGEKFLRPEAGPAEVRVADGVLG